jgi:predicted ATPase
MNHQIKVEIKDFRAIHHAEIILDGITVVTGENGCGKSTISKLLYQTYKTANNFDTILKKELHRKISAFFSKIGDIAERCYYYSAGNYKDRFTAPMFFFGKEWQTILNKSFDALKQDVQVAGDALKKDIAEMPPKSATEKLAERVSKTIKPRDSEEINKELFIQHIDELCKQIMAEIIYADVTTTLRPIFVLDRAIQTMFSLQRLHGQFNISEDTSILTDTGNKRLNKSFCIKQQVYIDTPMAIGVQAHTYWQDLNTLLQKGNSYSSAYSVVYDAVHEDEITANLSAEVLEGDVALNVNKDFGFAQGFIYKRKDGLSINLLDCATGLKSFAILQLLYKNGTLRNDTLVIIDEPEAHLHPQWVVEYARLIVLLNKIAGVRFFIASHNPDMISAIRYIAEKEKRLETLNFYLAKKIQGHYSYDYNLLAQDIEPIFTSFNIALDRINQYASTT